MKTSLVALGVAALLTLTACGGSSSAAPSYTPPAVPSSVKVTFEAFKTLPDYILKNENQTFREGDISVTLGTPTGIEQHTFSQKMASKTPGTQIGYMFKRGAPVTLSVQNDSRYGEVTCRISVNDEVISESTSTSNYGIASCSGVAR